MEKDDWLQPRYFKPEYHLQIDISSDLAWTWWKMIDVHQGTVDQTYHPVEIYWTWWKMIDLHPSNADQSLT